MTLRTWHKVHKWIAISAGIFFLAWTVSGIVMVQPIGAYPLITTRASTRVDFSAIQLSPAQAIESFHKQSGNSANVTNVSFQRVRDVVAYALDLEDGTTILIDARTAQPITISPALAEQIAREDYSISAPIFQMRRIDQYEPTYPGGMLPVYRIIFDNDHSVTYYVSANTGAAQRSDNLSRVRNLIASVHTFEPITLITKRAQLHRPAHSNRFHRHRHRLNRLLPRTPPPARQAPRMISRTIDRLSLSTLPDSPAQASALSVVVVVLGGQNDLARCLAALRQQTGMSPAEVIVSYDDGYHVDPALAKEFCQVQFLCASGRRTFAELRSLGVHAAHGDLIAITEDHCTPRADWCAQIVQAHIQPYTAIGGAVESHSQTTLSWAIYLVRLWPLYESIERRAVKSAHGL